MDAERMSDPFQEAARVAESRIKTYTGKEEAVGFILEAFASIRAEYDALRELERVCRLPEPHMIAVQIKCQEYADALAKLDALRGKEDNNG